ncbi:MAG: metallophosphoesterase [Candidatus Velthaea sp.]
MKRRNFCQHIGWTGTGIAFAAGSLGIIEPIVARAQTSGFSFVQISDSHIGFHQAANEDVPGTLARTVAAINALPNQPAFVVHTGDITHLSKADEFDTAKHILGGLRAPLLTLPGEHDVIGAAGLRNYFGAFGKKDASDGWYSWDDHGIHFVALVNVFAFERMGLLGGKQLDWLAKDLAAHKNDKPVVVLGHVPLYALYPKWGWTTEDGAKALALLSRFSSVTVLNGHIHQIVTHTEGNMRFYTAAATAYPQPAPGTAEQPGPLTVPKDHLLSVLGYRTVRIEGAVATVADHDLA